MPIFSTIVAKSTPVHTILPISDPPTGLLMHASVRIDSMAGIARISFIVSVSGVSTSPSIFNVHRVNSSGLGVNRYDVTYKSLIGVIGTLVNGGARVAVGCGTLVGVSVGSGRVLPGTYTVGTTRSGRQPAAKPASTRDERRRNRRRFIAYAHLRSRMIILIVPMNAFRLDENLQNNRPYRDNPIQPVARG